MWIYRTDATGFSEQSYAEVSLNGEGFGFKKGNSGNYEIKRSKTNDHHKRLEEI